MYGTEQKQNKVRQLAQALPYLLWDERPLDGDIDLSSLMHIIPELCEALLIVKQAYMTGYYDGLLYASRRKEEEDGNGGGE